MSLLCEELSISREANEKIRKIDKNTRADFFVCVFFLRFIFNLGIPGMRWNKKKEILPGFIDMTLHIEKGRFEFVEAHHMVITPKVYEASVSRCRLKTMYNKGKR